ncbi:MAG: helix-turn-helix transcriptional regulator [Bacteroidetes bacterium]|nr:helix-turn-helix transcriptional regulator [Bacteroidota bacterium]
MNHKDYYNLFFRFIETWLPSGFRNIDQASSLMLKLENHMEANHQFFFVADMLQVKILFTSKKSIDMLGVRPEDVEPSLFFKATHPDDLQRHNLARTKLFSLGQNLYIAQKGFGIISTSFRTRHVTEHYSNKLVQCYLFYTEPPYNTVFLLQVVTDISWFTKMNHGYHYYTGIDLSAFRYPDEDLLLMGNIFSDREFEIIKLISSGLTSEQISKKIFLSVHTVNTHRRNILKKSGKPQISDLIYDLKERGLL